MHFHFCAVCQAPLPLQRCVAIPFRTGFSHNAEGGGGCKPQRNGCRINKRMNASVVADSLAVQPTSVHRDICLDGLWMTLFPLISKANFYSVAFCCVWGRNWFVHYFRTSFLGHTLRMGRLLWSGNSMQKSSFAGICHTQDGLVL